MPGKCTTIRRRVYEEISGRIQISPQVQKVTVTFEVATNQSAVEKVLPTQRSVCKLRGYVAEWKHSLGWFEHQFTYTCDQTDCQMIITTEPLGFLRTDVCVNR